MKILILGANGYLGSRLFLDLRDSFDVVGTYNKTQFHEDFIQLDITDRDQVKKVFNKVKPDVVIHTANFPSPRFAKDNEENYKKLNLTSSEIIKDIANQIGAKVIFISSFAALNPDNIYGKLKLESEQIIKDVEAGYLVLRPSLILGFSPNSSNDRPFDRVFRCIENPELAEFDTSWKFQPTYIGHLSDVIKTAIENNIFNHVVHVFSPSIETQFSTAQDILKPFNIEVKAIDKQMDMPLQEKEESELTELGFPTCSYQEMIDSIHEEIRNKDRFKL